MYRTIAVLFTFFFLLFYNLAALGSDPISTTIPWQTYSKTVLVQAESQHHPILLFAKSKLCQWCKKMVEETFKDPAIIQLIKDNYVPIMVDVENNIEIARQYKITNLPTLIVLNADHAVITQFSGYLSPQALAKNLNSTINNDKNPVFMTLSKTKQPDNTNKPILSNELRTKLQQQQITMYDITQFHGWDGDRKDLKYLDRASIEYAMTIGAQGNQIAKQWAEETFDQQYNLLDPVWGGMYRYSTHGDWQHPNFEKLASVQADNMRLYIQAYAYWQNPSYLLCAQKIADYIENFLTNPKGEFYAGQSAYMVAGVQDASYYQLDDHHRRQLGIPKIDTNIYPIDNGTIINSLTFMYMMTGNTYYLDKAIKASDAIEKDFGMTEGGFRHSVQNSDKIYLGDNLAMSVAFITLYKATADTKYLMRAEKAMNFINQHFQNTSGQPGFVMYSSINPLVKLQSKPDADENSMVVRITSLLYHYTKNNTYKDMSEKAMRFLITPQVQKDYYPALILMADIRVTQEPLHLTTIGPKDDPLAQKLYQASLKFPSLYVIIHWQDKPENSEIQNSNITYPVLNKSALYVCYNNHCSLPIFDPRSVTKIIEHLIITTTDSTPTLIAPSVEKTPIVHETTDSTNSYNGVMHKNLILILLTFWFLGLLLSLTPCVLPLVLILTSLIAAQSASMSKSKFITLAMVYVLSLALTYALVGLMAASFGIYLQAYLQKPFIILILSVFFIILAGSLLGFYQFHLPLKLQRALIKRNRVSVSTTYVGVILMGMVITLIASPCAAAPLLAAVTFIGQTGQRFIGASALFAMGLGVGTPLLVVTLFGSQIIPKKGKWQEVVKIFFGLLLIGIAIWLLSRIVPAHVTMFFWSAFVILIGVYMNVSSQSIKGSVVNIWGMLNLLVFMYGIALFYGALIGNTNPLHPISLKQSSYQYNPSAKITFQSVRNLNDIEKAFANAKLTQKPILLEFYANWCVSCHEMDQVFLDPNVHSLLANFILLRVDITEINSEGMTVAKYFKIIAPPAILFFDPNGNEMKIRINDNLDAKSFAKSLEQVLSQAK